MQGDTCQDRVRVAARGPAAGGLPHGDLLTATYMHTLGISKMKKSVLALQEFNLSVWG